MTSAIRIGWSGRLDTGIAEIDEQHRYLVDLINTLGDKYGGGVASADALEIVRELERYSIYHFATEEALMAESGCSAEDLQHHRNSHQNFIRLLQQVARLVETSPGDVIDQLLAFLLKWLMFHICGEDTRMARAVLARRGHVPAAPADSGETDPDNSLTAMVSDLYDRLGARSREVVSLNARLREELAHSQRLEGELRASEQRWKQALEASSEGVWDWDIEAGRVCYSTRPASCGEPGREFVYGDAAWWNRVHAEDARHLEDVRRRYLAGELPAFACEFRVHEEPGVCRWVLSKGLIIARDAAGRPTRMIGTHQDITERRRAEAVVEHLAHFDALTDLPNRALFQDRAAQAIAQARRRNERLALLYLDLDQFKPINDRYGHDVGDAVLCQAAQRLLACIRASDVACRQGGDEFLALLTAVSSDRHAEEIAGRIRGAIADIFEVGVLNLQVTVSMGISYFPDHGENLEALLRRADAAMYLAKAAGGNGYTPAGKECALQAVPEGGEG